MRWAEPKQDEPFMGEGRLHPEGSSDQRIRHLEGELEAQRRELADYVAGLHRTIGDLRAELAAAHTRPDQPPHERAGGAASIQQSDDARTSSAEIGGLKERLERSEADRVAVLHRLEAVQASTSWRITAPLRALRTRLGRRS